VDSQAEGDKSLPEMQVTLLGQAKEVGMEKEEVQILMQLTDAMNEAISKLEYYYTKRDIENFNKCRQAILEFQQKMSEILGK
jgi:hypothetical protein